MFGATNNNPTNTFANKSTSLFGQSAPTNTFGQPNAFGSTNTFAALNPQPQQQTSLFGQASTNNMFGMSQPSSLFGAPSSNQTSTFGSLAPSTSTTNFFGSNLNANKPTLFSNPSTNTFGQSNGSSINLPTGTTIKFAPQTGTDTMMKNGHSQSTSINIRLQCITCMREYESKSLEELRFEDYQANRKGGGAQQNTSLFGSTTLNTGLNTGFNTGLSTGLSTGNNLFGNPSSTSSAFGSSASTGNLFGQSKSTFGTIAPTTTSTTNSFFGTNNLNANKPSTLFGQNTTNTTFGQPNAFGATSTSAPFGALNTQPQQGSLFTQPSTNTLFGNKSQSNTMFGATNNNPTNTFGSIAPSTTTTSFFGSNNLNANKSTSLFGQSAPTNTFGQPNAFGSTNTFATLNPQPQQQTSLFGQASTNNMFGMSQPSSLFGAPSSNQTSTFGSLAPSTSTTNFFGSNLNANKPTLFSNPSTNTFGQSNAFGSIASAPFGSLNTQPQQSSLFGQNSASTLFATNQQSQIDSSNIITRLQTLPYGSPQLLVDSSSSPGGVKTKFTTDPKTLNQYKINAKAQAEVKVQRIPAAGKPTTLLFDGLDDESADNLKCAQDIFLPRPSIKKLVLNKNNTSLFKSSSFIKSPVAKENEVPFSNKENRSPEVVANTVPKQVPVLDNTIDVIYKLSNEVAKQDAHNSTGSSAEKSFTFEPLNSTATEEVIVVNNYIPKCGIILNRTDYYTIPSIEQCDAFYDAENDSCIVDSFTVGRVDYGSIFWKGPLNVKGINLDEIVHIRRKEVIVYPDDEAKPTIGEGLNRPAQITLDQVWPIDKTSREFIKDVNRLRAMKYADKVEAATIKLDATFKEYRPDTGSWVFTVKHFSKYGLDADDEDIDMDQQQQQQQQQPPTKVNQNGLQNRNISTRESTNENYNHFISAPVELFPKGQNFLPNGFGGPLPKFGGDMQTSTRDLPSNYIYGTIHEDELDDDNDAEIDLNQTKELSLMRSAFFLEQDEEVDTVTKKCKNMSFTKSTTSHQIIPSLFPSKFKSTIPKRRKLEFEAVPSQNKANIYSVTYSTAPKVNFFNGSNRFCIVYGGRVLIFKANFLESGKEKDEERKLQEHLTLNSEFISSNNSQFPPMIKTNKFSLIVGADVHLNSLIEALYGELSETLDFCRYQERIRRIVNWLFTYNKTLPVPEKKFDRIMHFLTTNELEFAVTESVNSKQPRLSYLLASGQYVNKDLIMSQLDHWKRSGSDAFIEHDLLKLYILLSGQSSWTLSTGQTVEVFEGLEWTQQLILLLLYKNLDVKDTEMFETNLVKSAISLLTVTPKCVEYYLLAQSEPWVAISACTGLLDSWLLHESLFSFNVIAEDIFNNKSDSIHLHLASQAKDLRWALFFALHIRNDFTRYHFVMDLLVRNSPQLMDTEVEKFLVDKLAVDKQLISDAKLLFIKDCPKASRL